jgi:hypothetical protein
MPAAKRAIGGAVSDRCFHRAIAGAPHQQDPDSGIAKLFDWLWIFHCAFLFIGVTTLIFGSGFFGLFQPGTRRSHVFRTDVAAADVYRKSRCRIDLRGFKSPPVRNA